MENLKERTQQQANEKSEQIEALAYAIYLVNEKHENAKDLVEKVPNNIYIEDWKREEKRLAKKCELLKAINDKLGKELDTICDTLQDYENNPDKAKYYGTFCGHKVSDYALKYGRLDYATLSKCFDAVLCNNIQEIDPYIFDNIESGDFQDFYYDGEQISREQYEKETQDLDNRIDDLSFDDLDDLNDKQKAKHQAKLQELQTEREKYEETERDIFQWFIVSNNAIDLLKEANELVFYSEALDCYIWGVDHWGTSWDYVLTSIKLQERED